MIKKSSLPFLGFLQASGLLVYILLIAWFVSFAGMRLGNVNGLFYGPVVMLLLFIISAVVSALLVLGKAGILFWDKKYKESFTLLGWTLGWCLFYLISLIVYILK